MRLHNNTNKKMHAHLNFHATAGLALWPKLMLALVFIIAVFVMPQVRADNNNLGERLEKIVIPKVNLEDAEIGEALDWLRQAARRHDPEGRRLNLMLDIDEEAKKRTITMELSDIQIADAIRYICYAGGLQYRITNRVVMISSSELPPEEMKTRFFRVSPGALPKTSDEDKQPLDFW